jgi:hypothetical protein
VRQLAQPLIEVANGSSALAVLGEIAGMDQQIAVRNIDLAMEFVRVRYADDPDVVLQSA